jgi:hypothetical protein
MLHRKGRSNERRHPSVEAHVRRSLAALALSATVVMAMPAAAVAAGTLDQSNTSLFPNSFYGFSDTGGFKQGQTFTAGLTGLLDQVDVNVGSNGNGTSGSAVLAIFATSGGLPTGTALTSEVITGVDSAVSWVQVPLTTSVPSAAGTQYAIVLTSPDPTEWSWGLSGDDYAGGTSITITPFVCCGWLVSSGDKGFKTYVTSTAPAAHGIGFWRADAATTSALLPQTLGAWSVGTFAEAKAIFDASNCGRPRGDAVNCLAGQLLATKLSIEAGSDHACIDATVSDADTFLSGVVGYHGVAAYTLSKTNRNTATTLQKSLGAFVVSGCTS